MRLSGKWLVVQSLVKTILYKLLRLVFITVQRINWELNGTAKKLREARLPQNYERSAQVLDVVLLHKFCILQTFTVDNFLCTHNRFENPQYIIDNDNITLWTINERDVVFCEAKEKGWYLYCMRTYQGRIQDLSKGGGADHGERVEREPIAGAWGRALSGVQW